jgi:hypothetical protein
METDRREYYPRTIIEFCCGPDSLIGRTTPHSLGCHVVRLTQEEDVTSNRGLVTAMEAVDGPNVLLWGSLPCTGGSAWQRINKHRPGGHARLRKHFNTSGKCGNPLNKLRDVPMRKGGPSLSNGPKVAAIGIGRAFSGYLMSCQCSKFLSMVARLG